LKGDLSPFKRASARQIRIFIPSPHTLYGEAVF